MSQWRGKLADLGSLVDRIEDMRHIPSRASKEVATGIERLIIESISSETDPYGNQWQPLTERTVRKKHHDRIMFESGALIDSVKVKPRRGAGVEVSIDVEYVNFHQTGFTVGEEGYGPPRPSLPDGDELPDAWNGVIESAVTKAFGES